MAIEFTVESRSVRTALSRPRLAFASGFGAGMSYTTAPYVVVCAVGQEVVCEFPARTAEHAEEVAESLRQEVRTEPLRTFFEKYAVPSHMIDRVAKGLKGAASNDE